MRNTNRGFYVYYDWFDMLELADSETFRGVMRAICAYNRDHVDMSESFDGDLRLVVYNIISQLKRMEERSEQNRAAANQRYKKPSDAGDQDIGDQDIEMRDSAAPLPSAEYDYPLPPESAPGKRSAPHCERMHPRTTYTDTDTHTHTDTHTDTQYKTNTDTHTPSHTASSAYTSPYTHNERDNKSESESKSKSEINTGKETAGERETPYGFSRLTISPRKDAAGRDPFSDTGRPLYRRDDAVWDAPFVLNAIPLSGRSDAVSDGESQKKGGY